MLLIMQVILHNLLGVSFINPIASTSLKFGNRLRIKLLIVYVVGQTDRTSQRDCYKTAATTGIAEDIRNVCRSNERRNTWQRDLLLAITMATCFQFFAAERTIVGPPMSMFSIASSSVQFGLAMVAAKG